MFLNRVNPFNDFDHTHPLLSYVIRDVRGGRTPQGLMIYTNQILWIVAALMFGGIALILMSYQPLFQPAFIDEFWSLQIAFFYMLGVFATSIFSFPIVDLVTLFFTAVGFRQEMNRDVKFDLLRTSPLPPEDYAAARMTLAAVRSWRVFVFMWWLRLLACIYAIMLLAWSLVMLVASEGLPPWREIFQSESIFAFVAFLAGTAIFLVFLLWEPFWRFRMMTAAAASIAARVKSGFWMWLLLGGAYLLLIFLQGGLAVGASMLGFWVGGEVWDLLDAPRFNNLFQRWMAILIGFIPFAVLPPIVWFLQTQFTRWRVRVLERFIFRRHGEDA